MLGELIEKTTGVGLIIISNSGGKKEILTVKELESKWATNKLAGMRSFPMETVEEGEVHHSTLTRVINEEVIFEENFNLSQPTLLGKYELRPGIVLYAYLITIPQRVNVTRGAYANEVDELAWIPIEDILAEPIGSLRFRPGVREVVSSYKRFQQNPDDYSPALVRYEELSETVPYTFYAS